jgi:hypothetical protein
VPGRVKEQAHETKVRVTRATTGAIDSMTAATNEAIGSLPEPVAVQVEKARRHPATIAAVLITLILVIWKLSRRNG